MSNAEKVQIIQKILHLTQVEMAERLGVSFVTLNSWRSGKTKPHPNKQKEIDQLFLEITGQAVVARDVIEAKTQIIGQKMKAYKSVLRAISENTDVYQDFVLKLTYHSNSIEGSTLTERDTADIIFNNISLQNKTFSEQLEARNHQAALGYLFARMVEMRPITEEFIMRLHEILMNGIQPDAGLYRQHAVRIVGANVPTANYVSVPKRIQELMADMQGAGSLISNITKTHATFEQIHPFSDGNGRVGRLLMAAMLLKNNCAPAIIDQKNRQLYYAYLQKAQTSEDQSLLENFLCDAVLAGFDLLEGL